ncbi:MAG: secretion activator protein [Shinella sp.]|nr:MAG: secretion activator protein [Shinella sp.]
MDRFDVCHPITAAWEGGWSDHPDDPGGATMYGVTQVVYDAWRTGKGLKKQSVRLITRPEALEIYRQNYWIACGGPSLYPGVDLAVYDASVNSGVSRGKKWLKASLGSNDHSETVKKICRARLSFMQSLAIWKTFGKGWGRRVADIEAKGVSMALAAMGLTATEIKAAAVVEAKAAATSTANAAKAEKTVATGGGISTGGAATVATDNGGNLDISALLIIGAAGLAIVAVVIVINARRRAAAAREEAYSALAMEAA